MIDQIIQFFYSLLFFVTPILMSKDTSELFEFNKMLFIYVATVLIAFFWLFKMVVHKKIILKKTSLDIPIIFFFLSQLISTIFSLERHTSIFGYYGRFNGGLISTLSYMILYYAFVSNSLNVEKILKVILTSSLFVILWAIPGKLGHDLTCLVFNGQFDNSCWDNSVMAFRPDLRTFSTLGQPNWLGAYLVVSFFIGIYYLIKNVETRHALSLRIFTSVYLFLNFSMILFTRSRSALLAVLIGLAIFTSYYFVFIKSNVKKVLTILLIIAVIPIIFFKTGEARIDKILNFQFSIFNFQKKPVVQSSNINNLTSTNVTESFDIRKIVWQGAWDLSKKYPLFGTGVETFAFSYNFVRPASHNLTSEWDYVYNKAHNEYLNFLATTGFVGLGVYLCFIVVFVIYIIRKFKGIFVISAKARIQNKKAWISSYEEMMVSNSEILTLSLFCGWLTILITNFFGFSTTTIQLFFFLIPAFIIGLNSSSPPNTSHLTPNNLSLFQNFLSFLLLSSTVYLLFSITVYYLADVNYSYGLKYLKPTTLNYQKAASYFERALKLRQEPVYEDKFSGSLAYISALAAFQKQNDLAKQIAALADSYNKKTIQKYPKNIFYWKTRAKNMYYFYQVTGNDNELLQGVEALKTAKDLYPTDPKISYTLALYYSTLYDSSKNNLEKNNWKRLSLEKIENTIELKLNFREAYLFKGQLLKKYGEIDEARQVFEYILKNFNKNDSDVLKELKNL